MNTVPRSSSTSWADPAGVCFSLACAIHCLVTPLLVTALPFAGLGFLLDERTELFFVLASLTLASGSLAWGFRIHRQQRVLLTFGAAAALLVTGRFFLEGPYEIILVAAGAGLVTVSHILNFQFCRSCDFCEH